MFYMPGTRMLFGDARVTTEGESLRLQLSFEAKPLFTDTGTLAIKAAIESRI
jgi:hypothetical protein